MLDSSVLEFVYPTAEKYELWRHWGSKSAFPPAKTGNSGFQKNCIHLYATASVLLFCSASLRLQWFMVQRRQILPGRGSDILSVDVFVKQVLLGFMIFLYL